MYHIAVSFDVQPERRDDFIAAALEDGRNSGADEPGTQRFELIVDEDNPNRFYLNEAYDDAEAFDVHANDPHFARFFELIKPFEVEPIGRLALLDDSSGILVALDPANGASPHALVR